MKVINTNISRFLVPELLEKTDQFQPPFNIQGTNVPKNIPPWQLGLHNLKKNHHYTQILGAFDPKQQKNDAFQPPFNFQGTNVPNNNSPLGILVSSPNHAHRTQPWNYHPLLHPIPEHIFPVQLPIQPPHKELRRPAMTYSMKTKKKRKIKELSLEKEDEKERILSTSNQ